MPLPQQTFDQLVSNQVTAAQASSTAPLDFSSGGALLALIQANVSGIALWLQALLVTVLAETRAASSVGADLDSWMADFEFSRLQSVAASGLETFGRFINTSQAVIPVGSTVQTINGATQYTVQRDTTNVNYNAAFDGYVLNSGTSSIDVPITANVAGTAGNASSNVIIVITSPLPYVDTATNNSPLTNGTDAETDEAYRLRFVAYLASLSKATLSAIEFSIAAVVGVLDFTVSPNVNYAGATQFGYFYVVVDDGSGAPPAQLLANVASAIDAVVGLTINFGVFAPIVINTSVVMTMTVASGYTHSQVATIVQAAVTNFVNSLALGQTLYYTRIAQVAYDSSPGVLDVNNVLLNGAVSDITISAKQIAKVTTVTIN